MYNYLTILFVIIILLGLIIWYFFFKNKGYPIQEKFITYRQIPNFKSINNTTVQIHPLIDYNNYQENHHHHHPNSEMTNEEMKLLLSSMVEPGLTYKKLNFKQIPQYKYDYYQGFTGKKINRSIVTKILLNIMNQINKLVLQKKNESNYIFYLDTVFEVHMLICNYIAEHAQIHIPTTRSDIFAVIGINSKILFTQSLVN